MTVRYRILPGEIAVFLILTMLAACSVQDPAGSLITPPAISVQITGDFCPSIEAQAGMHIAWTNQDNVNHVVILERVDEQGVIIESGGTDQLQPGDTFSILLNEAGQYTYYCYEDRKAFGMITVLPGSHPYP